jgi:heptosyltransferase-3
VTPVATLSPDARVLVIAVARIGDTLLATPMLRALKQASPRGYLEVMTHPKRLDVLRHLPFIDRLTSISKGSAWLRSLLRTKRFDWAFVFGQDLALVKYALRVSDKVVAFRQADDAVNARLHDAVDEPIPSPHAVWHRLLLLRSTGVNAGDLRLAWQVTVSEREAARAWLAQRIVSPDARPIIGLQLASFHTKSHRDWPVERFVEMARLALAEMPHARFVLLGDHQGIPAAEEFRAVLPECSVMAAGTLSLRASAALVSQLDLYVGVDTGPTHIAGALGIPMVALYHAAYPGRNLAPLQNPLCRVIEHPNTGIAADINADMSDITAASVWAEGSSLLQAAAKRNTQ